MYVSIMSRVIFYYQTFKTQDNELISLDSILYNGSPVTHIHIAAIHFGVGSDSKPYIHLNNRVPTNEYFDGVWKTVQRAVSKNITIVAMICGAGGGYSTLFSDFETYYKLLYNFLKDKPFISGIDLDIEEICDINNIKKLINRIVDDFGKDFIITVAPIQESLSSDIHGMGGFCYKDLMKSTEGSYIDYINCQAYSSYTLDTLDSIINNDYKVEQMVMGMISGQDYKTELEKMYKKYGNAFGGIFIWEYFNTIPSPKEWVKTIANILSKGNKDLLN